MNKLLKLVYSNKFFALFTLLIQLAYIFAFLFSAFNIRYFLLASYLISAVLILLEINRHEESGFKITWIMLIAIIPVIGWFLYIYAHTGVISRSIKKSQHVAQLAVAEHRSDDSELIRGMDAEGTDTALVKFLSRSNLSSVYKNTAVKYYPLGDDLFPDILSELESAEKFIFMEFFIINSSSYMWRRIVDVLERKAAQGVDVRLMYDGMGCLGIIPKEFDKELLRRGIKCRVFSPMQPLLSTYQNNRDHRKIIVIDGECAISGGINLADEYINRIERFGHWKDTGIRIYGAGVAGFTEMFLSMWYTASGVDEPDFERFIKCSAGYLYPNEEGYIVPFGDSPLDGVQMGRISYVDIINNAKRYVYIMTPYFAIDDPIYDALKFARGRGVDVKLILPGIPDKKMPYCLARSYYLDLLDIGVEIYEYTPGFIHAKTTVSDGCRAIVGTINYDYRSLYLHYECAAYLLNVPEIRNIELDALDTISRSARVTYEYYKSLPWYYRFAGRVVRLIATVI